MSATMRNTIDRRVQRTRQVIVEAVTRLMFSKGVAFITMANVADAANVGRSTLYEHFKNKDELLAASITPLFDALAHGCVAIDADPALLGLVTHFWGGRAFARAMLTGRTGQVLARVLMDSFERALMNLPNATRPEFTSTQLRLAATFMAQGTTGVLLDWLSGKIMGSPPEIITTLRVFATAYQQGIN